MEGVAGTPPLLVYNRIDANRRKTRMLLGSFAVILLPLVSGVAALIFPFIHMMFASMSRATLQRGSGIISADLEDRRQTEQESAPDRDKARKREDLQVW